MTDTLNHHRQPLILVVDDGMTIRLLVREALEQAGFLVEEAEDGRQALTMFQQLTPDLVLLDVMMPELDGFETCAALRKIPSGEHIPIVMLTGLEDEGSIHKAYEVGATDFITKPINWVLLGHRVRYLLRASRAFTELRQNEEALRQEVQISTTLAQVGRDLTSSLATPVILERLCQITAKVLGCESSHALLWNAEQDAYTPVASWGYSAEQWSQLRNFAAPRTTVLPFFRHLAREEVIAHGNAQSPSQIPSSLITPFGFRAALCLVLRRGNEVIGVQTVGSRRNTLHFTPQQHRLAIGIAQFAALALENARLLEQAESANRLKSDFLATVSHELRTPLQIILGYKDLLLEQTFGPLTPEQIDTLRRLERSAQGLLELINNTLQVGRLEAGQLPVDIKEVAVAPLLTELQNEMWELFQQSGLQLECRTDPELPTVNTDPNKLKVVIKNLIGNAIKFTEKGKIVVDVQAKGEGVEIAVSDTGTGISPEDLAVIFEAFRQGEQKVLTRRHGGVGLGLYIVKRMLELLGGQVSVESVVGQGSTFRIWLPLQRPGAPMAIPAAA
jgi:two-component system, cell cycle sensor histidine kinase PleC